MSWPITCNLRTISSETGSFETTMRFVAGLFLSCGFLITGGIGLVAAIYLLLEKGWVEETWVACTIGGSLFVVGGIILVAVLRTRATRQSASQEQLSAVALSHLVGGSDHHGTNGS